jgi:drug/metabolite transporter (DMT)-like permease
MNNSFLFPVCILIFSTSWFLIGHQVHHSGNPLWPLVFRFFFGGLFLFLWMIIKGLHFRLNSQQCKHLLIQSILMFSFNFMAIYMAAQYLVSGVNALMGSMTIFFNILNGFLFLKQPIKKKDVWAGLLGLSGLVLVLMSDVFVLHPTHHGVLNLLKGMSLGLLGAYIGSCGHIWVVKLGRLGLQPLVVNAYGMLFGSCITAIVALSILGKPIMPPTFSYWMGLFYLSLIPTALGFVLFTRLIHYVGPQKAGYVFVTTPVVAMIISGLFEEHIWTHWSVLGIILVLLGYLLSLRK